MHVGTQNVTKQMEPYVYKRTKEGVHYLDIAKTWEKLMVAARIIGAVQEKNPKDVLVSLLSRSLRVANNLCLEALNLPLNAPM